MLLTVKQRCSCPDEIDSALLDNRINSNEAYKKALGACAASFGIE